MGHQLDAGSPSSSSDETIRRKADTRMTNRQTASFLIRRFRKPASGPDTRRGQNFLIDLNLLQCWSTPRRLAPDEVVLEVGTGTGVADSHLARRAAAVVTVEVDSRLQQLAAEQLIDFGNVTMLRQDALKNKNNLDAESAGGSERHSSEPVERHQARGELAVQHRDADRVQPAVRGPLPAS